MLSDQLRKAIKNSGKSHYELAKAAGVSIPSIGRFMKKERGLNLSVAEQIAEVLGLELRAKRKNQK